jgi:2-oxo-4-hydroxy-4-carboxy--5-ureidoimidazoline (OHCU) decarboxylase
MVERARSILGSLSEEEKIRTLNAHPRIGERPDGMSAHSRAEQAAGGDGSGELADELREMNAEYERRFGFRFVVFVNRRPRRELLAELRERMGHSREQELKAGLDAIMDIASDRLRS